VILDHAQIALRIQLADQQQHGVGADVERGDGFRMG